MRKGIGGWTILATLAIAALGWATEPSGKNQIDDVRAVMEKWVETQRTISKERHDWMLGREMLEERIRLVQREIASLRERIDEARKNISDADIKRTELVEENEKLKRAGTTLADIMATLERRTLALNKQLPDPIRERIKPLSQRLPDDPSQTQLSLSQRFQNVIGILNEINKFNRSIEVASEVRKLADGSAAEVTALYLGLGQAHYTGANATVAGVGRPGPEGWQWQPANDATAQVAEAIAILNNEKVAGFVLLPVKVEQGDTHAQR